MVRNSQLSGVLHVLLHMAHTTEPLTSEVLARAMGTNPVVLRRIMAGLRNAGHVTSGKGHGGGWVLARPLWQIRLIDIHLALGSPGLFAIGHRSADPECKVEKAVNAALSDVMAAAESLLLQRFADITLDQIDPEALKAADRRELPREHES